MKISAALLREFSARLSERNALLPVPENKTPARTGDWFSISNLSAEHAEIRIFDEIGVYGTTAQGFVDQLNAISTPKITVYLNSLGGEVFDGIAIHTALAMSKAHVTTYVTGVAASAASFIAMAGDNIKIARNATMMIHDASGLAWGNAATMRQQADLLDKLSDNIADMYQQQAGGDIEHWRNAMLKETWYTGTEALAAGLVDEIAGEDEDPDEEPVTTNRLTFAAFNYAGRAAAPAPEPFLEVAPTDHDRQHQEFKDSIAAAMSDTQDQADLMLAFLAESLTRPERGTL